MAEGGRPLDWIDDELAALASHDLLRRQFTHAGPAGARLEVNGRLCVNFGSNDYLGLAADPRVAAAACECIEREGWGSAASPLLAGRGTAHARLEADLAAFEETEAAILFSSGFAANLATVTALVSRGDCILADETNHASLIDGCRLSRAEICVYPHNDWRRLEELLDKTGDARRRLIVTDALYSMNGDLAPLVEIADLAERHQAMLMVDEAHATGVFGTSGRGVAEYLGVSPRIDIRIGTLSKALGGVGGFVCGRKNLIDWLVNRARGYIFSTALPAAACAAASAACGSCARSRGVARICLPGPGGCAVRSRSRAGTRIARPARSFRWWSASRNGRRTSRGIGGARLLRAGHPPPQRRAGPGPPAHWAFGGPRRRGARGLANGAGRVGRPRSGRRTIEPQRGHRGDA